MSRRRDYVVPSTGPTTGLRWTARIRVAGDDDTGGHVSIQPADHRITRDLSTRVTRDGSIRVVE